MSETKCDWQEVVDRSPRGYVEMNDGKRALYGPIESIVVDECDFVTIILKWSAEMTLGKCGIPTGEWTAVENNPIVFPNFIVSFTIDRMPEKGDRVLFGGFNILFFDKIEKVRPEDVKGLELEGNPTT
ncbi:hypothetical protein COB55_01295 [Candidatus Wolfebacteria bacterium]|nr:MAG: hypothetical protein COB55_01295 [Candidatus Wolfebacteria bacterium]